MSTVIRPTRVFKATDLYQDCYLSNRDHVLFVIPYNSESEVTVYLPENPSVGQEHIIGAYQDPLSPSITCKPLNHGRFSGYQFGGTLDSITLQAARSLHLVYAEVPDSNLVVTTTYSHQANPLQTNFTVTMPAGYDSAWNLVKPGDYVEMIDSTNPTINGVRRTILSVIGNSVVTSSFGEYYDLSGTATIGFHFTEGLWFPIAGYEYYGGS